MPTEITPISNRVRIPPTRHSYVVGSRDLSRNVIGLRANLPWNGRATLSTTFADSYLSGAHTYQRRYPDQLNLRHHNRFAIDQSIEDGDVINDQTAVYTDVTNVVSLSLESMGLTTGWLPRFLGGGWQDDNLQGAWPAYDFTVFLEIENQHMSDVMASASATQGSRMAHEVMGEIFRKYGITSFDLRFPDHAVKQLRRNGGRPSDWLGKVRQKTQSGMRFRGGTAVVEPFRYRATQVWPMVAGKNYSKFTWRENDQPPKNKFILSRVDPVQGRIGGQKCTGRQCPGRTIEFDLNPPSSSVRLQWKADPGALKTWVFEDVTGVLHQNELGYYQGLPARKVYGTYEPTLVVGTPGFNAVGYESSYEVNAYAGSASDTSAPYRKTFQDKDFHFGWRDTTAEYGVWRDYSNSDNETINSGKDLDEYGEAVLLESVRHCYSGILTTPFINAVIEPGHWIHISNPQSVMNGTYWFVEAVSYALSNSTSWVMELAVSKGLW